jgi:ferredoxin
MYELLSIRRKCKQCWTCETLLPGFITRETGYLRINECNRDFDDMKSAAHRVVDGCPNGAIIFREIRGEQWPQ